MCKNNELADRYVAEKIKGVLNDLKNPERVKNNYLILVDNHYRAISNYCYLHCKYKEVCPHKTKVAKINENNLKTEKILKKELI